MFFHSTLATLLIVGGTSSVAAIEWTEETNSTFHWVAANNGLRIFAPQSTDSGAPNGIAIFGDVGDGTRRTLFKNNDQRRVQFDVSFCYSFLQFVIINCRLYSPCTQLRISC